MLFNHADKADVLHRFYSDLLGTSSSPTWRFDLRRVLPPVPGLSALEVPFTEQEAKNDADAADVKDAESQTTAERNEPKRADEKQEDVNEQLERQ